jgi:hypothetical protein
LWRPFSPQYAGLYRLTRNLYKNVCGNKLLFEEINHDLDLTYRYAWRTGDRFGFIKTTWLKNIAGEACAVRVLDGLQNLLPYGATTALQDAFSNLLNAYKRNELDPETGLGLFSLSSTQTDLAEPSESLMATTVWQVGLDAVTHLLSTRQVAALAQGGAVTPETDVRGVRGAYLVCADFDLAPAAGREWSLVADVNQDSRRIVALRTMLKTQTADDLRAALRADITRSTAELTRIVAQADGLQSPRYGWNDASLRQRALQHDGGGIFADNYQVGRADFADFCASQSHGAGRARGLHRRVAGAVGHWRLLARAAAAGERRWPPVLRVPAAHFSRRHGDPSARGINSRSTSRSPTARKSSIIRATGATSSRTGSRWPTPTLNLSKG